MREGHGVVWTGEGGRVSDIILVFNIVTIHGGTVSYPPPPWSIVLSPFAFAIDFHVITEISNCAQTIAAHV